MQPRIEVIPNAFELIFPNMNYINRTESAVNMKEQETCNITPKMKVVLEYLSEYGEIRDVELQELLNVKRTCAYLITLVFWKKYKETLLFEVKKTIFR